MNSQGAVLYCSSYGHVEAMAYALAEGTRPGAIVVVKPVAGDGPGNRLRRVRISNSTRRRRHAGAEAGRCGSRDRALSRSAPLARSPDDRSLRSPSSVPHRQGAENRRCGLQGLDASADVFARCLHQQIAGFVDDRRRQHGDQRRQMAGERHPSWTDDIVALIAPQASCRRTSRSGNFRA
jgi:hypothetical protein